MKNEAFEEIDEEYITEESDPEFTEEVTEFNDPDGIEEFIDNPDMGQYEIEQLKQSNQLSGEETVIAEGNDLILLTPEIDYARREELVINSLLFNAKRSMAP